MASSLQHLEDQFSVMIQALDNALEDNFGTEYKLHPNRPKRGVGANPSYDGLFATTVAFTLGYGSTYGRGYIVNVDFRTLECISSEKKKEILDFTFCFLCDKISFFVPNRQLSVVHDGKLIKIVGDFSQI